jgi:cytochrome c biogenesis protein
MGDIRRRAGESFISQRFAVIVIAILFGASAAGWLATELVPANFVEQKPLYIKAWGIARARLIDALRLYDPFHSFWYRTVLALFFVVLLLCVITRWRQLLMRSLRLEPPRGADELRKCKLSFEHRWRPAAEHARPEPIRYGDLFKKPQAPEPDALAQSFARVASYFRKRGYREVHRETDGAVYFAAGTGRWRSPGNFLFHLGILAVTVGGIVGSFTGWKDFIYVRAGDTAKLPPDSLYSIHVEDFQIITTKEQEIREYVSTVSVFGPSGALVKQGTIEVNRPLSFDGRRLYQSQYSVDENSFKYARIEYALRGRIPRGSIDLTPDAEMRIPGTDMTVRAKRYFPDFRMGDRGPYSASGFPSNPALEIVVKEGGDTEQGFLFLYHPQFNKEFRAPVNLVLAHCEPIFYTGLEVSSNPASPILFIGFLAGTLGLILMYVSNPRTIKGVLDRDALFIAGTDCRWKASFTTELGEIGEGIRRVVESSKE